MKLVVVLTGNSLAHNPRVFKEAEALAQAGFDVDVFGAWLDSASKIRDQALLQGLPFRFTAVVDWTGNDWRTTWGRYSGRVRTRLGLLAHRWMGLETGWQLGQGVQALARAGAGREADLYIAHSEPALQVSAGVLGRGKRVGVDMEDWYSEDLLPEARKRRPIKLLKGLERQLLNDGGHRTCPSGAMSAALGSEYRCRPPAVVYNAFKWSDRDQLDGRRLDRGEKNRASLHWYSQTLGHGRGLEDLFEALPMLRQPVDIHLRGHRMAGFDDWLTAHVPPGWRQHIYLHPLVSNAALLSRIAEHDIGFAGEMQFCRNRDLTVTNKILHYLLGGLAVVASDTAGQREVAEQAQQATGGEGPVRLYRAGDPASLAAQINALLASPERLAAAKASALLAARRVFCWERQAPVLVESVRAALAAPIATPSAS